MAELGQLSYSIILDDKKFTKQAQGIVKKLKDVDSQINDLMSSDSTRLSKPFDLAGMSIEKMVTQAKVLEAAFKGLSQSGTGVLSQDAINLKLRWQEIQAEVAKYGLNLKSSLMEQQKIVEPLKNLQQVLAMPTNSLDEVAAKLSEVKRIRAEQIQTDASYISNMSVLNKVEGELIAQQKSAIFIGKEALTVEQQLTSELQKRPISINDIIASAKNLEVLYKSLDDKESALGVEAQQRWLGMRNQLQSYGYVIKSSVMEQQTLNGALAMQENTVGQIELKMRALSSVRKNINVTEKESIETLKKVNDEYMRLSDQLKKVGARQYNLADLARNTNGAFSPLGFSIQQVARELPSLTMGAQMFFLAISNNLPILSDELRKAKESYKALVAEGKTAVPVWKQVISSIFSWQTAMVVGITLLTMYGREIGNWIKGLFSAKKANDDLTKATLELNGELSKEATALNLLFNKLKDTERGTTERRKAVENLNSKYGEYIKNLNLEKASLDDIYIAQQQVNSELRKNISLKKIDSMRSENDKKFDEETKDYYETLLNNFRGRDQGVVSAILDQMVADSKRLNIGINKDLFFEKISQAGVNVGDSYKDVYKNLIYINKELSKWELSNINIENVSEGISSVYKNQIEEQKDLIKEAETALKLAQSMPTSDESQIVARNKAIKSAQDELNRLNKLGIYDKSTKTTATPRTPTIYSKQDNFESDQIRAAEDLQTRIEQARINAMDDGFEKRIAQMKLNHQTEIREIDRQREDLLRKIVDNERKLFEANPANKGKKFDSSSVTLPKTQQDNYTKYILDTEKKQNKELSDEYSKALEKYRTYAEARIDVLKKFETERKAVIAAGGSEKNLSELNRQQKEALSELDKQYAMKEESYKKWLDGIANLALDKLIASLREAELALSLSQISLKGENDPSRNTQQVAVLRQQIEALKKQIETEKNKKTGKKNSDDPSRTIKDWKRLESVLDRVAKSFDEIGEAIGGTVGDIISAAGQITTSTLSMINGITTLANGANTAMKGTAKAAASSIQAVEKASVILAIISAALQIATKIASLFAADYSEYNKAKGVYESYIAVLDKVIEKQKELVETMTGENARNSYEYALELIKKQEAAARELGLIFVGSGASIGSHSKGRRAWDRISDKGWNELAQWNKELSGMAYGAKNVDWLFGLSGEELQSLQETAPIFWAQLGDDIGGYLQAIIDSEEELRKMTELYQESLTGLSFDDARDSLKDFLLDTDTTMQDIADNFEDYMKNAIVNSLIKGQLTDSLKKWYENFADYAQSDGQLTQSEIDRLRNEYNSIYEQAIKDRDNLFDIAGIVPETNTERTGLSGSLARASQESIDELTGVMYAGLEKLSLTSNGINAINITTTAMSAELKAQTMLLRSIDNYSSNLPYMRTGIESMVNQGVRIKP